LRKTKIPRPAVYAGAKTTRLTGDWAPVDSNVNDIIYASSPVIRARVRQLVRDFPYLAKAVNLQVYYVVGSGIQFQSRVSNTKGSLDAKKIQQIEDAFSFWADDAEIHSVIHSKAEKVSSLSELTF
jgi:capsid protein